MCPEQTGDIADLAGLEGVWGQLEEWLAVVRAERARADLGMVVSRPVWKNLVFTGGAGTGKSWVARSLAGAYRELGFVKGVQVIEAAAAGMAGATAWEARQLVNEAFSRGLGRVLMITGAQAWRDMPDGGMAALTALYEELSAVRQGLVVVLAGEVGPVGELLAAHRPLAARFAAVIDFPGYMRGDLGAVFARLAADAGFVLGEGAQDRARVVLMREAGRERGSSRLAVSLLAMVTVAQARRITASGENAATITRADIPDQLDRRFWVPDQWRPGQYL